MINVFIADDHAVVRQGIEQILREAPDITVVGEAEQSYEIIEKIHMCPCHVIILDLSMPGRSGLEVLREIKREYPSLAVLILSMHPEDQFAVRAMKAGASGYLTKSSHPSELINAIRKVYNGGKYVSPALIEKLAFSVIPDNHNLPHEKLSDRELQVMRMIAAGKKAKEIAEELSLSVRTVNTYRARILDKMHMKSNADMARYSLEHGLID